MPEPTCATCRSWRGYTRLHDDSHGGWIGLGHCEDVSIPRGLTTEDYHCDQWEAQPNDRESGHGDQPATRK